MQYPNLGQYPYKNVDGQRDAPALTWLRNHSNYLTASGFLGTVGAGAVYLRGFFGNLLIITPILLLVGLTLGLFHRTIIDHSLWIGLGFGATAAALFACYYGRSAGENLHGRASNQCWWCPPDISESKPTDNVFTRFWKNAFRFHIRGLRNLDGAVILLGTTLVTVLLSPYLIEFVWRKTLSTGISLEKFITAIIALATISGTIARYLIGWKKIGTIIGIGIIAAIGALIIWLITLRVAAYVYYGTPPTGWRCWVPLSLWLLLCIAYLFEFVVAPGQRVRQRWLHGFILIAIGGLGGVTFFFLQQSLNSESALHGQDLVPLTQSVSNVVKEMRPLVVEDASAKIDRDVPQAIAETIRKLSEQSRQLGRRYNAGTLDDLSQLNPEDYSLAQRFLHTAEEFAGLPIDQQQLVRDKVATRLRINAKRELPSVTESDEWLDSIRLTLSLGAMTEKPWETNQTLLWSSSGQTNVISQSVVVKLVERYDKWNKSLDATLTEQANVSDDKKRKSLSDNKFTEFDLLPKPLDVPTESQASDYLQAAIREIAPPGMSIDDLRNVLADKEPLSRENEERISRLIVHAVQPELVRFRSTILYEILVPRLRDELPSLAEIEKTEVPKISEHLKSQRSLALLAIYGRTSVREIAREALGELFDPSIIPWKQMKFDTDDVKRQRQEELYLWKPGTGLSQDVLRLALTASLTNPNPRHANELIRRMMAGRYGNFEGLEFASNELFEATRGARVCLILTTCTLLALFNFLFNSPNFTSIHQFYRDRLSTAFIVEPIDDATGNATDRVSERERPLLSRLLDSAAEASGPYPLLCAALNLQGSSIERIRDRDADSFVFSPLFVGSELTGFARTTDFERYDEDLTVDTAMALSAAAVAPSMGKYTVSWVAFLITILNLRLGRWLTHPLTVSKASRHTGDPSTHSEAQVLENESRVIEKRRINAKVGNRSKHGDGAQTVVVGQVNAGKHFFGLALSGGGIRSASVSLGVTQALDSSGLFKEIDYLSSVSGGGYTATAISTFMRTPVPDDQQQAEPYEASVYEKWIHRPPARYLFREMTGAIRESLPWVYVSDGGHFENTGAYELLRRRCELIVISDGEEDGGGCFPGLSNLMRLTEIDFGFALEFPQGSIEKVIESPAKDDFGRHSKANYAVAKIRYGKSDDHGAETGWLLYIRSSILLGEDAVITNIAKSDPAFPHQSTGDQNFDELQFEAYRRLGENMMKRVIADLCTDSQGITGQGDVSFDTFRAWLQVCWKRDSDARAPKLAKRTEVTSSPS